MKRKNNEDFTIEFWIRTDQNPAWKEIDSDINFGPVSIQGNEIYGIFDMYVAKIDRSLKIYILNQEFGYRKLKTDITEYLGRDLYIVITNTTYETTLFLNGVKKMILKKEDMKSEIEIKDMVMAVVNIKELPNIITTSTLKKLIVPAKVLSIKNDRLIIELENPKAIIEISNKDLKI